MTVHSARILVIDYGSQYTQLIARRIRELNVYSEIMPWDVDPQAIIDFAPHGVILSGGPNSVTDADAPAIPECLFTLGVPLLGLCYGMQILADHFGGKVQASNVKEFGYAQVEVTDAGHLLTDIADGVEEHKASLDVWMSHGDKVVELPDGFITTCTTASAPIAGMASIDKPIYGLQFHPEVTHTRKGKVILGRFVHDICGCNSSWTTAAIIEQQIEQVRATVGTDQVLLGLSGGVDSSVVAALLHEAIGDQLTCIFVDTGLLRYEEGDQVMETFAKHMGVNVIRVNAADQFYAALTGVHDPEAKRKVIGREFINVFDSESKKLDQVRWLAQGTIYPDVIESAGAKTGKAQVIKSHHNVGGLPDDMQLQLVEPLRELFKDEVRTIGRELGLPAEMVDRHPFPGPGLGVRMLGAIEPEHVGLLQHADHIFIEELRRHDLYHKVAQAFAVFLPVKSVGVVGDGRRYEYVIALRAVETVDFMTARWAHLPYEFLDEVSRRIINEITGVSRVVYDISGKPPATIEWE